MLLFSQTPYSVKHYNGYYEGFENKISFLNYTANHLKLDFLPLNKEIVLESELFLNLPLNPDRDGNTWLKIGFVINNANEMRMLDKNTAYYIYSNDGYHLRLELTHTNSAYAQNSLLASSYLKFILNSRTPYYQVHRMIARKFAFFWKRICDKTTPYIRANLNFYYN